MNAHPLYSDKERQQIYERELAHRISDGKPEFYIMTFFIVSAVALTLLGVVVLAAIGVVHLVKCV